MSEDGAAERFWLQLQALYQAAGRPTLKRLVHLGLEQRPPVSIGHSTINGWLNRTALPTGPKNERYLTAMIAFLQGKVRPGDRLACRPEGEWMRLLRAAQAQRAEGQRQGRPRRPDTSRQSTLPRELHQRAMPAVAYAVTGPAVRRGPLIGRDAELAVLADQVNRLAAGHGGVVFIEGEPGIGKSTLVQAALADCAGLGCQVFWSTASELDEALPLQLLFDGLRVRDPSANPRRETIARFLRGEIGLDRGMDGPTMLAEQLLALITEECARPTVLVIDDLQWADRASIRLLTRLASSVRQLPLLLVTMMRPVPQRGELPSLCRTAGDAARLRLTGLAEAHVAALVASLAGGTPDRGLMRLARDASGNPLYLTELMAALSRSSMVTLTDDGTAALAAGPAPRSLSAAIADRLDFIAEATRGILQSASLLGPEFTVTDLATLLGRSAADLAASLREACAAGILTESGAQLRFRHPLIHTALYEELPGPVRAAWHREAGRALATAGAPADRVARQLALASGDQDGPPARMDDWAVDWLAGAAESLISQAPQVAARLLSQAVAGMPVRSARRSLLASHLADALFRSGERTAAEQLAATELAHVEDPDVLVGLHLTLAQCRIQTGATDESLATLEQVLRTPGLSARHRGRLRVLTARTHLNCGEIEKAGSVTDAVLAEAESAHDTWAEGWALHILAAAAVMQGRVEESLSLFDRGLAVSDADPALADLRLLLQINKGVALGDLDRCEEALAIAGQARRLANQVGSMVRLVQAHNLLGQLLFETGQWDDAFAELSVLPESLKDSATACCDLAIAALISFHRGETAHARSYLAATAPYGVPPGFLITQLTLARSLDQERAGALPAALATLTSWLSGGAVEGTAITHELVPDAVRLAVRIGDTATAQTIARQSIEFAATANMPYPQANALYCRGLLAHDAALLLEAAERYGQASRPLLRARALEAAAAACRRTGDEAQAQAILTAMEKIYDRLGIPARDMRTKAAYETAGA